MLGARLSLTERGWVDGLYLDRVSPGRCPFQPLGLIVFSKSSTDPHLRHVPRLVAPFGDSITQW